MKDAIKKKKHDHNAAQQRYTERNSRVYIPRDIYESITIYAHTQNKTFRQAHSDLLLYGFAALGYVDLKTLRSEREVEKVQRNLADRRRRFADLDLEILKKRLNEGFNDESPVKKLSGLSQV
ncbi:hypothetical protein ACFLWX_01630 [Chloroflexota bacterium]